MLGSTSRGPIPGNGEEQKRSDEQNGRYESTLTIKVSHGSNLHDLAVPSNSTFGDLKGVIAREIGIKPQTQKLLFRGKQKDDSDLLQMAGVKDNSKVLLLEDAKGREINSEEMKETSEVSKGDASVAEVRAEVDKLSEQVASIQSGLHGGSKIDEKDIIYLTEMLMKQLLKLDMIEAAGEGKIQRKMEVRRIQSLVGTVDALKAKNSNPFIDQRKVVSVSTEWEQFDSGVGELNAPTSLPHSTQVTQEWEHFD